MPRRLSRRQALPELRSNQHGNPHMNEVGLFRTSAGHSARIAIFRDVAIGSAVREKRRPAVDIHEALAYTAPGFAGHESAMKGGSPVKVRDFGRA